MNGSVLQEKSSFKMLGLTISSKLGWSYYIISITKTAIKKIGALICSMKFLSAEVALYLYRSNIWSYMEYFCHIWAGAICYVELLDKLQKGYAGLLALHLLPLSNPWFIVDMYPAWVFSIDITLVDVHLNWLNWFHFLILEGGLRIILIDCMTFLSPFLDVRRMSMSTVSFLAQLNSWILC